MEYIGKASTYLFGLVIGILLGGLLVMKFWSWFIVPTFGIDLLTFGQAVGLSVFITLFKSVNFNKESDHSPQLLMISLIVYQLLLLGFGWIISLFI